MYCGASGPEGLEVVLPDTRSVTPVRTSTIFVMIAVVLVYIAMAVNKSCRDQQRIYKFYSPHQDPPHQKPFMLAHCGRWGPECSVDGEFSCARDHISELRGLTVASICLDSYNWVRSLDSSAAMVYVEHVA